MGVRALLSVLCALATAEALALKSSRVDLSRRDVSRLVTAGAAISVAPGWVLAGASTDLKTDRILAIKKYEPRVLAGRSYWKDELPKLISARDWNAIGATLAVTVDPKDKRKKRKLEGPVLALFSPLELWASSFSRGAQRSEATAEMLAALDDLKAASKLLEEASASEVKDTGLLGIFGAKKEPSAAEREKNAKQGYADGTKAFNAYIDVLNGQLKLIGEDLVPRL